MHVITRFSPEEKAKRHPCAYLPFGLGPRNCIGMRFALIQAKMALIEVVKNFRISLSPETKVYVIECGCENIHACFYRHLELLDMLAQAQRVHPI